MKIIGVGLNKTGTTTLGVCFQYWNLRHISCDHDAFDLWRTNNYEKLFRYIEDYDSFEDWPWALIYKEIDDNYSDVKFILTRRKDALTWYKSLCSHADRTGPTDYRKYIYGYEMPHAHKKKHIAFYEKHLKKVRSYFEGRENDFLEVCWEEGDGWNQLSNFLSLKNPNIPFPHANKSPDKA